MYYYVLCCDILSYTILSGTYRFVNQKHVCLFKSWWRNFKWPSNWNGEWEI